MTHGTRLVVLVTPDGDKRKLPWWQGTRGHPSPSRGLEGRNTNRRKFTTAAGGEGGTRFGWNLFESAAFDAPADLVPCVGERGLLTGDPHVRRSGGV